MARLVSSGAVVADYDGGPAAAGDGRAEFARDAGR
jgi:hypothetical protein